MQHSHQLTWGWAFPFSRAWFPTLSSCCCCCCWESDRQFLWLQKAWSWTSAARCNYLCREALLNVLRPLWRQTDRASGQKQEVMLVVGRTGRLHRKQAFKSNSVALESLLAHRGRQLTVSIRSSSKHCCTSPPICCPHVSTPRIWTHILPLFPSSHFGLFLPSQCIIYLIRCSPLEILNLFFLFSSFSSGLWMFDCGTRGDAKGLQHNSRIKTSWAPFQIAAWWNVAQTLIAFLKFLLGSVWMTCWETKVAHFSWAPPWGLSVTRRCITEDTEQPMSPKQETLAAQGGKSMKTDASIDGVQERWVC